MQYGTVITAGSFSVDPNEFVRLVVPDPFAKNALLDCLMGNLKPTRGTIRFWGRENRGFNRDGIQQKVGWLVFKKEAHAPWIRLEEYLRAFSGIYRRWNPRLTRELITALGLDLQKRMNLIDNDEQIKINLVKALAFEPELLIMDELPVSVSDSTRGQISQVLAKELARREVAVVLVTTAPREKAQELGREVSF